VARIGAQCFSKITTLSLRRLNVPQESGDTECDRLPEGERGQRGIPYRKGMIVPGTRKGRYWKKRAEVRGE